MKKLIFTILFLFAASTVNAGWIGIDSSYLDSDSGSSHPDYECADALDGISTWLASGESHWFILDFGSSKDIKKIRSRSSWTGDPIDVDIYVSNDTENWGTAVATGIDTFQDTSEWIEYDVTDKSGRYMKIVINEVEGSNLTYGHYTSPYFKIFDVWEGNLPDKWTSYINLLNTLYTTTSGTYEPTNYSLGAVPWDGSKYTNITEAYLEMVSSASGSCPPNSVPTTYARLYDVDNATEICSVLTVTPSEDETKRSTTNCADNLPSGTTTLRLEVKNGCQTSSTYTGARLIIIQEAQTEEDNNKMRVYIPLGGNKQMATTNYIKLGSIAPAGSSSVEKHYYWDEDDFATIDAVYFGATLSATSGYTAYAKLDDVSGSGSVAELTETSTSPTWNISADISGSISDNTTYTTWIKTSESPQTMNIENAMLIIDLSSLTKYQTVQQFNGYGLNTTTTGWTEEDKHEVIYDSGDDFFYNVTETTTHQGVLKHIGDTDMEAGLYENDVHNTDGDISTTDTTFVLKESSAITSLDNGDVVAQGYDLGSSGFLVKGQVGDGKLLRTVTSIDPLSEAARRRMWLSKNENIAIEGKLDDEIPNIRNDYIPAVAQ